MSYKRVRPRNSKRNRPQQINGDNQSDCCPIPSSVLKTFVEQNPSASESTQIEAFLGELMIPEFNENEPNLVNTTPQMMAEYRRQRQLIQKIKDVKRQKKRQNEWSGLRFSFSSEPFFTVLVKISSNLKPSINDIQQNLQHLGTIEDIVLTRDGYDCQFAFVRFESSDVAFGLYQTSDAIKFKYGLAKNVSITVFPKPVLCSRGGYECCAFMRPIDGQLVVEKVRKSLESGQHLNAMKEYLLLTETDCRSRLNLCEKLETIVNNNQIGCKFHVFGSTINELGFCDSDIDVFIEIFEENNFTNKMDPNLAVTYLIKVREVLGRVLRMYIRPTIQSRRCPLVKLDFRHFGDTMRSNGISCDLSLVNSLGIHNSKLIAFYCKLEPHFQTLAVILRYLAKINGFIGSSQMSSYAFTMLIIFFCQNLSVPLLPTVYQLMQMKTKEVKMNGLECGFCDDINHYRKSFPDKWNESEVNYLFELFFKFYTDFDFRGLVICPRTGHTVLKSKFDTYLGNLRVPNVHEFKMTELICIQDPFDLTFNMTHHMPYKMFLELRAWFRKISTHSHEYFNNEFTTNQNIKTFVNLLEPTVQPIEEIKKQIEADKRNIPTLEDEDDIQIIERVISKHLIAKVTINLESNIGNQEFDIQLEDWALKVSQFFRLLYREGFKMKSYISKPKSKINLNENSTFQTFLIKFKTTDRRIIDMNVRDLAQNEMSERSLPLNFIKRQTLITEAIVDNSEHCLIIDDNSEEIRIELELTLERSKNLFINITEIIPQNDSQLTKNLIDFICQTFRLGLEAEQLLTIDDDIVFL